MCIIVGVCLQTEVNYILSFNVLMENLLHKKERWYIIVVNLFFVTCNCPYFVEPLSSFCSLHNKTKNNTNKLVYIF
jgi:hypothetical protein